MRFCPLLVLALIVCGCSSRATDNGESTTSPEANAPRAIRLAYTRYPANGWSEIWVARADGTDHRRLARGHFPRLSADGRWVLYNGGCRRWGDCRTLELLRAAGGRRRIITRAGGEAKWSPDSRRVVFASGDSLVSYELARRRSTVVTRASTSAHWGWDISPHGDEVVYAHTSGAHASFGFAKPNVDLYIVSVHGGSRRRLTNDRRSAYPIWGPTAIAFSRLLPHRAWGRHEIWRINPDGSGRRTITGRLPQRVLGSGIVGLAPFAWSADGRRLLAGLLNEFGAVPYAVDPARGTIRKIGDYGFRAAPDGFSNDGRFVLVSDGNAEIDNDTRVEIIAYNGKRGRVIARRASWASWNR